MSGPVPVSLGDRPGPAVPDPVRLDVRLERGYRLSVQGVGLACCAVEFAVAAMRSWNGPPAPAHHLPDLHVLVIAGTVTDRMAPALLALHAALPEPGVVLSFGACSNTGGPYWDSYSVTKGVDQLLPVDVYVPGCPPRPEALVRALQSLASR